MVAEPVQASTRDDYRFTHTQMHDVIITADFCHTFGHNPALSTVLVPLKRDTLTRIHQELLDNHV